MALPMVRQFGAPEYGPMKGHEGLVGHTPENASHRIEDAIATAIWQASAGNTSGGSYHGYIAYDDDLGPTEDPAAWVLVKTVPFNRIAGSISTRRDAIWAPDRYPWLQQLLSPAAYADPNAYLHALCLSGKARWWSEQLSTREGRAKWRGALIAFAKWVRHLERQFDYDSVLSQHRHWQTNRSDVDGLRFMDWVLNEYEALYTASDPTTEPKPVLSVSDLQAQLTAMEEDLIAAQRAASRLRREKRAMKAQFDIIIPAAQTGREV